MSDQTQIVDGKALARLTYCKGFEDGFEAARQVLEVMRDEAIRQDGFYNQDDCLEAVNKARARAYELMAQEPVVEKVIPMPSSQSWQ